MNTYSGLDVYKSSVFACNKQDKKTITDALTGIITDTDAEMLKMRMEELELLEKQQVACLTFLEELATKYYSGEISLLCSIPGQTL
jgi:hypothetical protein